MTDSSCRSGFTLKELIVTTVVLVLLIGVGLMYLGRSSGGGDQYRAKCLNNMHQLAIAFENFEGAVESIDSERGIVQVIVTIFGRSTPLDIEYWQIEKV